MATFPVRLLCDIVLSPATGLDLRHLNMDLNMTCVYRKSQRVIKIVADTGKGQYPGTTICD